MDVGRPSPSGRALRILVLAGLWLLMVQPGNSRRISLRRRSNQYGSQGDAESIHRRDASDCYLYACKNVYCSSGKCVCYSGYTGPNCDKEDASNCYIYSCKNGYCSSGKCACNSGYTGLNCDKEDASYCSSSSCKHGSCSSGKCVCSTGYTGTNCDKEASSTVDYGLLVGLILGTLFWAGLLLFGVCCCCYCCCYKKAHHESPSSEGAPGLDTNTILSTVKAEENVYVDIAVISSGRW